MRPPVFLADPAQLAGSRIVLSGAEGRHAATVRRLGPGEHVDVTDGSGTVAECQVTRSRDGEIVLWAAERCVVQWRGDRGARALARWRSAGLAAAKQARRARFPEITALAGRDGAARLVAAAGLAILLDPAAEA